MGEALLHGLKVLELPGLGAACGRFLATLGAEVVKLEPPGGEAARRLANGDTDPAWAARNHGKSSVVADAALIRDLAARADVLIESMTATEALAARLDPDSLAAANPRLIQASITPFGRTGPYAEFKASELVVSALGGPLWTVGYEDRAPVKEALDACTFHACGSAAAGILFAHRERGLSGLGQHVDVSAQEVAASRCTSGLLAWQFDRRTLSRTGVHVSYGTARVRYVWTLADGYCFHGLMSGRIGAPANAALSAWMDEAGFDSPMRGVEWERYDRSALPAETRTLWETAIDAFFRSRTRAEIATEGRRRGINATVANSPADVLADPHLAARDFFEPTGPSRFVNIAGHQGLGCSPVPELGAGNPPAWPSPLPLDGGGVGGEGGRSHAAVGARVEPSASMRPAVYAHPHPNPSPIEGEGLRDAPLKGVRVLDFSWALVGSITTKMLADFGAEVVKVESSSRPCLSRIDVQVGVSKRGQFDDKPWFVHLNSSKKSLRLNVKREGWREIIDPLIDWADVVVENFSPGTMKSLGLDYAALSARRPDLVMVSGSVFGQTGPLAREWGVDGTGAALSSRLWMTGWADRPPVNPSATPFGDVILPPLMAAATAAALERRRRTGEGAHIDASMYEACVQQMAGALIAAQSGLTPERTGNDDPAMRLQGVYACAGDDRWIAVTAPDDAALEALKGLVGDGLDVAAWTAGLDRYEAMARLQAAGVPAGVVQDAADLIERDPQLAERGFLRDLDNPVLGTFGHQATPIRLSRTSDVMTTAPGLGQHTEAIARELCGLSAERYAALAAAGVFE